MTDEALTFSLRLTLTPAQHAAVKRAANLEDRSVSSFIRRAAVAAAAATERAEIARNVNDAARAIADANEP